MPMKFEIAKGDMQFNAVVLDINENNGKTTNITRITEIVNI